MLNSLRSQLLVLTLTVTVLTFTLLMIISFSTLNGLQTHNMRETAYANLKITTDSIDRNIELLRKMINWFSLSNDIHAFLTAREKYPNDMKFKAMSALNIIRNSVYSNGLTLFINKLIIGNLKDNSVQFGNVIGHSSDYEVAGETIRKAGDAPLTDPFSNSEKKMALPFYQAILDQSLQSEEPRKTVGHIYATVDTSLITRFTELNRIDPQTRFLMCIEESVYLIEKDNLIPVSSTGRVSLLEILDNPEVEKRSRYPYIPVISFFSDSDEEFVVYQAPVSGWIFMQSVPGIQRQWQKNVYFRLFLFFGFIMLCMVIVLTFIIEKTINAPLGLVGQRIRKISEGDFSADPSIEFENEIGYIGMGINHMVKEIDQLIQGKISHERTKRDLEFRILQSQINPHFLYNTLNSIKWMATLQKSKGIAEMVSSLAVLLKQLAKGTDEKITLRRELELTKEYCRIQNYRSAGMITLEFDIEDDNLLSARINQFTLQPLVENAIFHGIEPKQVPGIIEIQVKQEAPSTVLVVITDDGAGIAPEKIEGLFNDSPHSRKSMNHIGLRNVDERIKMSFGKEYGLSIESSQNEYTRVFVRFPAITGETGIR